METGVWILTAVIVALIAFFLLTRGLAAGSNPLRADVPFRDLIHASAARHGVDSCLLAGVVRTESSFDPAAFNPEPSNASASYGLGQLLLSTAREPYMAGPGIVPGDRHNPKPGDLYHPATNLDLAARYIAWLNAQQKIPMPVGIDAYNVGPGNWKKGVRNPVYRERVFNALGDLCAG